MVDQIHNLAYTPNSQPTYYLTTEEMEALQAERDRHNEEKEREYQREYFAWYAEAYGVESPEKGDGEETESRSQVEEARRGEETPGRGGGRREDKRTEVSWWRSRLSEAALRMRFHTARNGWHDFVDEVTKDSLQLNNDSNTTSPPNSIPDTRKALLFIINAKSTTKNTHQVLRFPPATHVPR
ncbi:hypothetical protein B0O99DRAFT_594222 [Bisporella sp. PMI_857]|nr:hypothetical protein B0O99DRAFT_594222 [Bisporella sp. PMI_857]